MNSDDLKKIKFTIECMENSHQLEILKLLKDNKSVVIK